MVTGVVVDQAGQPVLDAHVTVDFPITVYSAVLAVNHGEAWTGQTGGLASISYLTARSAPRLSTRWWSRSPDTRKSRSKAQHRLPVRTVSCWRRSIDWPRALRAGAADSPLRFASGLAAEPPPVRRRKLRSSSLANVVEPVGTATRRSIAGRNRLELGVDIEWQAPDTGARWCRS